MSKLVSSRPGSLNAICPRWWGVFTLGSVLLISATGHAKSEHRLLESGGKGSPSLTLDEGTLDDEREAIAALFAEGAPKVSVKIDEKVLAPKSVLTLLTPTETGFPMVLEVDLDALGIGEGPTTLTLHLGTLHGLFARDPLAQGASLVPLGKDALPELMTRPEEESAYFCHRAGASLGGVLAYGFIAISVNGALLANPVSVGLRRDAEQQKPGGADVLAEGSMEPEAEGAGPWVISWFSSDCDRDERGQCPKRVCEVPLVNLLDVANAAGLEVPSGLEGLALRLALKQLLGNLGLSVEGGCWEVEFALAPFILKWFRADCQCVVHVY